ncbi:bifunctional YncE family protein/alkaline phosphatase family protein [Edaphobacter albus]|uniref:bifunctional YncE family protein/alkaline phosphatase family protein n=1 Tax=Edaphobacter sp. 4G125 TaxID=2763071 RepID=UPI00164680AA|nr:bifunctional YncE family protein/alkaline phosphatase family protein [Edaphobacter sp. 4G125]QNI35373.1 bifunctional YncE family protein/alkaline phosphatase family protein [Edaphobacter sp. 4G125]
MPTRLQFSSVTVYTLLAFLSFPAAIASGQAPTSTSVKDHPLGEQTRRLPKHFSDGSDLPNGWRITPAGKAVGEMGDLVMNLVSSPDGKVIISVNSGFLPHAIDVFDAKTHQKLQHIGLPSTWLGMAWSSDGHTLYVSGGNASGAKNKTEPIAPIYEFTYSNGRLSEQRTGKLVETIDPKQIWWSGVAYLPSKHLLYAANRGTGNGPSNIVVFDAKTRQIVTRIPVETTPYQTALTPDGKRLFVSNWSSESVSVIDTDTNKVIRSLHVGMNPNDMKISADGRLFVACSNDNTVYVIDTHKLQVLERLSTTLTPLAPEGSTPDALAIDNARKLLYIANADNNSITVAHIENRAHSTVVGFIPTGWYPSALLLTNQDRTLYIGNTKGEEGHPDPDGPHFGHESDKTLQKSSLEVLPVIDLKEKLPKWTREVTENTPYHDSLLSEARPPQEPSVIPQRVGEASEIKHIIYIIKENRTYDQEFGDIPNANGDPKLVLFGEKVTPNQHALAKQYVVLDNLYCDGEVSVDGHSWSNSAYATDFNEKQWPPEYGGHSAASYSVHAMVPSAGHLWDLARRKGLTYRSYGENAARASTGTTMEAAPGADGLVGHVSKEYGNGLASRDTEKVEVFLQDLKEFDANYDSSNPEKRLPNYIVMSMPEDHTRGTAPGAYTPQAMVANNDYAIGQLVDAVSHSRYWPNTAIFIIEDDAQDGADHVDGRRTVGLVISPYVKRGIVDSTLYTTSSMVRSMELLLGLPPMSQYDAAAMPMYNSFGTTAIATPFEVIKPQIDVNAKNTKDSYGAKQSSKMDFKELDRAPMYALNEIIWKSIKGKDSAMPLPVHRFRPLADASESPNKKDDDD